MRAAPRNPTGYFAGATHSNRCPANLLHSLNGRRLIQRNCVPRTPFKPGPCRGSAWAQRALIEPERCPLDGRRTPERLFPRKTARANLPGHDQNAQHLSFLATANRTDKATGQPSSLYPTTKLEELIIDMQKAAPPLKTMRRHPWLGAFLAWLATLFAARAGRIATHGIAAMARIVASDASPLRRGRAIPATTLCPRPARVLASLRKSSTSARSPLLRARSGQGRNSARKD